MFGVLDPLIFFVRRVFCAGPIQDWKMEKRSSDIFIPGGTGSASDDVDEETPLTQSTRLSHIGRTQAGNYAAWFTNSGEYADSFQTLDP